LIINQTENTDERTRVTRCLSFAMQSDTVLAYSVQAHVGLYQYLSHESHEMGFSDCDHVFQCCLCCALYKTTGRLTLYLLTYLFTYLCTYLFTVLYIS